MEDCHDYLRDIGFPDPIIGDSGDGFHLKYPVDLPNNDATRQLMQNCLQAAAYMFGNDHVKVDTTVSNPSRIWKIYGSVARKGTASPNRPYRRSRLLSMPDALTPVSRTKLEELAAKAPTMGVVVKTAAGLPSASETVFDVQGLLGRAGVAVKKQSNHNGKPNGDLPNALGPVIRIMRPTSSRKPTAEYAEDAAIIAASSTAGTTPKAKACGR